MSNILSTYPLLGSEPTYDTKLTDPSGHIAPSWPSSVSMQSLLSHGDGYPAAEPKESRKRFRKRGTPNSLPFDAAEAEGHVTQGDSGDDMVVTDCETPLEYDGQDVHPSKRRLTAMVAPGPANVSGSIPGFIEDPIQDKDHKDVHPCIPTFLDSPHSPVSDQTDQTDQTDQNTQQIVLPSPSASPVQAAAAAATAANIVNLTTNTVTDVTFTDKSTSHTLLEHQLSTIPCTQEELINMVTGLSSLVSLPNRNHVVFRLLQRLDRSSLSALCGIIQTSLNHDLLSRLPAEISLQVFSYLDARSLLAVSAVCRRWHTLVNNTELWLYLLKKDAILTDPELIARDLSHPAQLRAEWGSVGVNMPRLFELCPAQILYKKRYIIYRRWMDPRYKPLRTSVAGHGANIVTCLQHDADKVVTGVEGRRIHVHATRTGRLMRVLEGHDGGVWALRYWRNTLVSGSTDRDVRVWNLRTGRCSHILRGHTSTVRCLDIIHPTDIGADSTGARVLFPPQPLLVTGSRDHTLHVWRLPQDNEASPEEADQFRDPIIIDARVSTNNYLVCTLAGHTQSVRAVAGYGNIVVSGSYDGTVRVWDLKAGGKCLHVLEGHTDKIYSTALSFRTGRCFSGSMDSSINVWDFRTGALLGSLEGHSLLVGLLELSDKFLVSAAADATLRVWNPRTGENLCKLRGHNSAITCFQHDALRIVSGSERMLKLWDIRTGKFVRDLLSDITGSVWQVSFDPDRCVAAVQAIKNGMEETYVEILDFSAPLNSQ